MTITIQYTKTTNCKSQQNGKKTERKKWEEFGSKMGKDSKGNQKLIYNPE